METLRANEEQVWLIMTSESRENAFRLKQDRITGKQDKYFTKMEKKKKTQTYISLSYRSCTYRSCTALCLDTCRLLVRGNFSPTLSGNGF